MNLEKKLVSIIIVNWNGLDYIKKCLCSLKAVAYPNYEIIVVDNGSADGSVNFIQDSYPHVNIIRNDINLGFAEANNIGYAQVKGEYVLLLNNDTECKEDFLDILVDVIERENNIGCVQPRIMQMDKPEYLDSVGSYMLPTGFLYHLGFCKEYDEALYGQLKEIYSAKGACMLLKKKVLSETGLFDKDYFAYFEETDLCHRVWLAGYRILYIPEAVIYHKMAATMEKMNYGFISYHSFKNRINSYLKNLGWLELVKILPFHLLICEVGALFAFMITLFNRFLKIKGLPFWWEIINASIQKAIWWNIVNIKTTLLKRRNVQTRIRKLPDTVIMKKIKSDLRVVYHFCLFLGLDNVEERSQKRKASKK